MARGRKTGGKDFSKGNKLAVGHGRPSIPQDVKAARKLTNFEFDRILNKYLYLPLDQLKKAAKDESLPGIDHMVLQVIIRGASTGDQSRLNALLDRSPVGRIKEKLEISGDVHSTIVNLIERHTNKS